MFNWRKILSRSHFLYGKELLSFSSSLWITLLIFPSCLLSQLLRRTYLNPLGFGCHGPRPDE